MRREIIMVSILLLLALVACSPSYQDPVVEEFLHVFPQATKESETFQTPTSLTREFFSQECDAEPPYTRTTYTQYGATLTLYTHNQETLCSLIDITPGDLTIQEGNLQQAPEGVAFLVNDEAVLFSELEQLFEQLPDEEKTVQNIDAISNQLINQKLLEQAIRGYDVTVQNAIADLLEENNLTREELEAQLSQQGVTFERFEERVQEELQLQALLDDVFATTTISDEQTREFYLENTQSFISGEQATFQQVFVQEQDPQQAQERMDTITQALNNSDFCTVVTQYSDDEDSKERCGEYTIQRGVVFPELERAVFTNELEELFIVEGPQGYHLVTVLERDATTVIPYSQAQQAARQFLEEEIRQLRLNAYLSTMREQATVINFLTINEEEILTQ